MIFIISAFIALFIYEIWKRKKLKRITDYIRYVVFFNIRNWWLHRSVKKVGKD